MHALLSPSGASRWLACTPSARAEESYPDSSNQAATEGTLAHELSELYLRNHLKLISNVVFKSTLKRIKANPLFNAEMDGHATDYLNFITDKLEELHSPMIFIEEKIDLQQYVPEGFGTVDCAIIADHVLDINDLKYGKGVLIEAHENKQMMLYALGALQKYSLLYEVSAVRMTIYQPRLNNFSSFEMQAADLIAWGEEYVIPKAKMAFKGLGEYVPGSHCKFCKVRNDCKALATFNMSLARHVFADPNKLTDEDMTEILTKAADFKVWLTSIQAYALEQALRNQKTWPGFKLVAGRSTRMYANPEAIQKALKKAKIDPALYLTEPKLVGITILEKNVGKQVVADTCSKYIIKPNGAPTLVPEWDKRDPINSIEASKIAFENVGDLVE